VLPAFSFKVSPLSGCEKFIPKLKSAITRLPFAMAFDENVPLGNLNAIPWGDVSVNVVSVVGCAEFEGTIALDIVFINTALFPELSIYIVSVVEESGAFKLAFSDRLLMTVAMF